jgi:hypothetical protein
MMRKSTEFWSNLQLWPAKNLKMPFDFLPARPFFFADIRTFR